MTVEQAHSLGAANPQAGKALFGFADLRERASSTEHV
jgi:hypothetical protein